jgi:G3E family GTPase
VATDLYLISGFLGAGKTSTLQSLLSSPADLSGTLVIVNEAGRLGLDGRLVERAWIPVRELSNGCVCCTLRTELVELLRLLLSEAEPPARIILEASGLANPLAVVGAVRRFVDRLGLIKTVAVVEVELWEARAVLGPAFRDGLAAADLVILNKIDTVASEAAEGYLKEIVAERPGLAVVAASYGRIDPELFLRPPESGPLQGSSEEALPGDWLSTGLEVDRPIPRAAWEAFLGRWGHRLERLKGQLLLDDGQAYIDGVRGRLSLREALPGVPGTRLVLIGRGWPEAELEAALAALAASAV